MSLTKIPNYLKERFLGQETSNLCGPGCLETLLLHLGIKVSQKKIMDICHESYEKLIPKKERAEEYNIEKYGMDFYHFENLAKHFELKIFTSEKGNLKSVLTLIDEDIWPIIHRPLIKNKSYSWGHYVLAYGHYKKEKMIQIFDPAYENWNRPSGFTKHSGVHRIESYKEFRENWKFSDCKNRDITFLYREPKNFQVNFRGECF